MAPMIIETSAGETKAPLQTIAETSAAIGALRDALLAKGYVEVNVRLEYSATSYDMPADMTWSCYAVDLQASPGMIAHHYGETADAAIDLLHASVEAAPHKRSPDDFAATIGLNADGTFAEPARKAASSVVEG